MRIEIRNNQAILDGYVNAVCRDSRMLPSPKGPFVEQIIQKTFQRALEKNDNVKLLFNHSENRMLGSTKEGNLQLWEDNIGLRAKCVVTDDEVIEKARKGELRGWSFGFIVNKDRWEVDSDGKQRRFIEDLDLLEVSILDKTPAYIATSIEERGENNIIKEQRNEEFNVTVEDNTKEEREDKKVEQNFSHVEKEIEFLKIKGGNKR